MWFEVGEKIVAHEATPAFHMWCQKWLILANPDYIKKDRMGLWTGSTPQQIYLYEQVGQDVILPAGCLAGIRRMFPNARLVDHRVGGDPYAYGSNIALYEYQETAVKAAVEKGGGIMVAPCGSGKTQMGLEVVARIGVKTLWVTHTEDLLNQSMGRAQAVLNCTIYDYGKITGGKVKIGSGITFATVQTMSKLDLPKYKDEWGCVVVDECHHCVGSPTRVMQFYKVLNNLNASHKYGLTATPKRADGLESAMFSLLGGIAYEVPREAVADTTCSVRVKTVRTGWMPSSMAFMGDGTVNYSALVQDLVDDKTRTDVILDLITSLPNDEPVLILGCRVGHLMRMCKEMVEAGYKCQCISGAGTSKLVKDERKAALGALDKGDIHFLFATYQLAKEGLDCPNLRHVVLATPEKDPTTIQQAAGRVGRKADGKAVGTVWDVVDDFGMYLGWAKKRVAVYKKLGYEYDGV